MLQRERQKDWSFNRHECSHQIHHWPALRDYELHVAFVSGPIEHPELTQDKVIEETLVLVTSPKHPLIQSIHDIQNHTMLVFP